MYSRKNEVKKRIPSSQSISSEPTNNNALNYLDFLSISLADKVFPLYRGIRIY